MGGQPFHNGETGSPILKSTPAFIECELIESVELGDHSVFVAKVVAAGVTHSPAGRADEATLWLKDLGPNVFYGG